MSEPRVVGVQFVLNVSLSDGTTIRGKAAPVIEQIHHQEDAHCFETLDKVAGFQIGQPYVQETILGMMANEARSKTLRLYPSDGGEVLQDCYEQCIDDAKFQYRMLQAAKLDAARKLAEAAVDGVRAGDDGL